MDRSVPDSASLLTSIVRLTQEMRQCALDSDWESVQDKEQQRQALIERCFPLDDSFANPAYAFETIREIIELDRSVMSMAAFTRETIEAGVSKIKLGRQATQAYTSVEIGS